MHLVVVESPSKAKTIEKYLGKGYKVMASKGHVVDLPKSNIGVDPEKKFKPEYVVTNQASLKALKDAFKDSRELILAVDPDREGEAIGWHIAVQLKLIKSNGDIISRDRSVKRIVFTEITKEAVQEALHSPRKIDMNLVNAQQARRVLDRIVGYKLSPLLWKKIRFGLSAGRVQSVAVKLIVDREKERQKFKADEYWTLDADVSKKKQAKKIADIVIQKADDESIAPKEKYQHIPFSLAKIAGKDPDIKNQNQAEKLVTKAQQAEWKVASVESKQVKRTPKPPFSTSTLQQAAANRFGFSSKETMRITQKLYEGGFITYMRTDSFHIAVPALKQIRDFIGKEYGSDYMPAQSRNYATRSKTAQEAHEAIRPSNVKVVAAQLKFDEKHKKLYRLIWERTVASQMADALVDQTSIRVSIDDKLWQANGQRIIFPGFLKIYSDSLTETILPAFKEGEQLFPARIIAGQHFTQPPARYSEASLIKAMESFGIGRPSTYAPTISTVMARGYVVKEGKYFVPTDTGIVVTNLLEKHFPEIVDTAFTAQMENDLDNVANGEINWVDMMEKFYTPFAKNLKIKDKEIQRDDFTVLDKSDKKCPVCGKKMEIKLGKFGRFLSCSDFPECKGMLSIDGKSEEDIAKEASSKGFLEKYKPAPKTEDGRDYILKMGKFGKFFAHPDYPKVKDARPLEYTDEIRLKLYGKAPKGKGGKELILRRGRFGEFWAHPDYPTVKEVVRINNKELKIKKKELRL